MIPQMIHIDGWFHGEYHDVSRVKNKILLPPPGEVSESKVRIYAIRYTRQTTSCNFTPALVNDIDWVNDNNLTREM